MGRFSGWRALCALLGMGLIATGCAGKPETVMPAPSQGSLIVVVAPQGVVTNSATESAVLLPLDLLLEVL